MNKATRALGEIYALDALARRDLWMNKVNPLVKLVLTLVYLALLTSAPKYDVVGVLRLGLYLPLVFKLSDLSFAQACKRLRFVLPLVCCVGLANPVLDANRITLGGFSLSAGWLSLLTLAGKGAFAALASYQLVASSGMDKICAALRRLRVPKILVTQLLLTYRYIFLLLEQAATVAQAYSLRAPRQKGVHIKVWGSLAGQLLLRSVDRANALYDSMRLRGFSGEYYYAGETGKPRSGDLAYFAVMLALLLLLRRPPIAALAHYFTGGLP